MVIDLLLEGRRKVVPGIAIHQNRKPWKIRFGEKNHHLWVEFDLLLRHPKPMWRTSLADRLLTGTMDEAMRSSSGLCTVRRKGSVGMKIEK